MPRQMVQMQQPLAGLDRAWAYQSQPPFSLPDALNVRCRDVFESRARLGSRPGLVKVFLQQLGGGTVESFTLDFAASKDAMIYKLSPDNPFDPSQGALAFGLALANSLVVKRTVLTFDMTSISPTPPATAAIVTASLRLNCSTINGSGGYAAKVQRLVTPGSTGWVEAQATWNSYATGNPWSTAGGDFTATDALDFTAPTALGNFTITGFGTLAQDAYANRSKLLHIILKNATEGAILNQISFNQRTDATESNRPKLTVTYEVTS